MLSVITMATCAAADNIVTLCMIAGVASAGITQPNAPYVLEHFGMDHDLLPSQNARDIIYGPELKRRYIYEAKPDITGSAISVVETEYVPSLPHQPCHRDGEYVEGSTRTYTVPVVQ